MNREIEIQSNVAEFNAKLQRLKKLDVTIADYALTKIVMGLMADLIKATPVDISGTLRRGWDYHKIGKLLWQISNETKYLIFVEYGVHGHPLSSNPEKRKRSLRYMFATGILISQNGAVIYNYKPKKQSVGFIRNTLQEWQRKAPALLRRYVKEWVLKQLR